MLKSLITAVIFLLFPLLSFSQSYEDWDDHDIVRFYKKIELDSYSLDEDGEEIDEIYVPTKVEDGLYEVEVYKVSSKLYQIRETNIYMLFRYSPYLYNYDEGYWKYRITAERFMKNLKKPVANICYE